jgi:Fanconi-associated nuclease 1
MLRYQQELGENIQVALDTLCAAANMKEPVVKREEQDIIDLTLDDDTPLRDAVEHPVAIPQYHSAEAGPSTIKIEDTLQHPHADLSFFAQDHSYAELPELLECLTLDELRQLAKDMKIRKTSGNVSSVYTTTR